MAEVTQEQKDEQWTNAIYGVKSALDDATRVDPLTQSQLADSKNDRELKKTYATWFIGILIGQLAIMNMAFVLAGIDVMAFQKYELELYLTGTLAEVFGIVLVITKNLFPSYKGTSQ